MTTRFPCNGFRHIILQIFGLIHLLFSYEFVMLDVRLPYPMAEFCYGVYDNKLILVNGNSSYISTSTNNSNWTNSNNNGWQHHVINPYTSTIHYQGQSVAYHNSMIYGIPSSTNYGIGSDLWIYNMSSNQYISMNSYNSTIPKYNYYNGLRGPCIVLYNNSLWIIGGSSQTIVHNFHNHRWSLKSSLVMSRAYSGCAVYDSPLSYDGVSIFIFGGVTDFVDGYTTQITRTIEQYQLIKEQPNSDKWILSVIQMTTPRYDHKCIFYLPMIYCIGGTGTHHDDGTLTTLSSIEIFNPAGTGSLVPKYNVNLNVARSRFGVAILNIYGSFPHIVVFGGAIGDGPHQHITDINNTIYDSVEILSYTSSPTISPTLAPTNAPSFSPSNGPSNVPSNAPSFLPTIDPSNSPSFLPTYQTQTPTYSPTVVNRIYIADNMQHNKLTYKTYIYVASILGLIIIIVAFIGYFHARNKNYQFEIVSLLMSFLLYLLDFISDIFFCVNVYYIWYNLYDKNNYVNLILFISSLIFLLLPSIVNLYEMERFIAKSIKHSNDMIMIKYFEKHVYKLYVVCFIIGNFYATFSLFSCCLLDLDIFKLSMNRKDLMRLENRYFIFGSLFENIPQLIVSVIYSIYNKRFGNDIVLFTYIFGISSIITSFFTFITRKKLIKNKNQQAKASTQMHDYLLLDNK